MIYDFLMMAVLSLTKLSQYTRTLYLELGCPCLLLFQALLQICLFFAETESQLPLLRDGLGEEFGQLESTLDYGGEFLIFLYFLHLLTKLFAFLNITQLLHRFSAIFNLGEGKDPHGEIANQCQSLTGFLIEFTIGGCLGLVFADQIIRILQRFLIPEESLLILLHDLQ